MIDCGGNLKKVAEVKREKIICESAFISSELLYKILKTKTFDSIFKRNCKDKQSYLKNVSNFGPRICERHITKLLSKEYAESRGCHNPKCIGQIECERQVLD